MNVRWHHGGARLVALGVVALGVSSCAPICEADADCREGLACVEGICAASAGGDAAAPGQGSVIRDVGVPVDQTVAPEASDAPPIDGAFGPPPPEGGVAPEPTIDFAARDEPVDGGPRPDAGPPAVVAPFGPEGDCFAGLGQGRLGDLEPAPGDAHVPQVACSAAARAWTVLDEAGQPGVAWDIDGDARADGVVPTAGRYALGDRALWVPMRGDDDRVRVYRVDVLAPGDPSPVVVDVTATGAREPVYADGRVAFVSAGRDGDRIHVVGPAGVIDCGAPVHRRWGVALVDDGVAWFERSAEPAATRLVRVDDADRCADAPRREHHLGSGLASDARLHAVDGALVWLAPDAADGLNRVWWLPVGEPDAMPRALDGAWEGNPLTLATAGRWLVINGYAPSSAPRYGLERVDMAQVLAGRPPVPTPLIRQLDARRPAVSGRYVLWTAQGDGGQWEVYYDRLP